ncbi:MAG: hypothetical protein ABIA12_02675 [Candidatus Aenigmatarchaeota archaeon]
MRGSKGVLPFLVLAGLALTIVTSLVPNTGVIGEFPDVRFVPVPMLGVSYWGSPLPWVKQVVYPGAPRQLVWPNLLADVLFWAALLAVVKVLWLKVLARPKAGRKAGKRKRAGGRKPKRRRRR